MNVIYILSFFIACMGLYNKINKRVNSTIITIILFLFIIAFKPEFLMDLSRIFYDTNMKHPLKPTFTLKTKKRNVGESLKKMVAANQQWRCGHCKLLLPPSYEIDHIIPLYMGGSNHISNLNALCRNCHGNKTMSDKIIYQ